MKKVLILSNHFATIYKFRRELVEKLVEKGYEVVVSLPEGDNKEIEALGVRIIETYVDRKSLTKTSLLFFIIFILHPLVYLCFIQM